MGEEIDIIELLKRVKEGKAPKEIEIKGYKYRLNDFNNYYREGIDGDIYNLVDELNIFDMINFKIKILDKPIIEELENDLGSETANSLRDKINEIIKHINEEGK